MICGCVSHIAPGKRNKVSPNPGVRFIRCCWSSCNGCVRGARQYLAHGFDVLTDVQEYPKTAEDPAKPEAFHGAIGNSPDPFEQTYDETWAFTRGDVLPTEIIVKDCV